MRREAAFHEDFEQGVRVGRVEHEVVHVSRGIGPAADDPDGELLEELIQLVQAGDDLLVAGPAGAELGAMFHDDHVQHVAVPFTGGASASDP
ncbi:hypothetical protein D3C72_2317730 [compost metagenome]